MSHCERGLDRAVDLTGMMSDQGDRSARWPEFIGFL